MRLRPSALLYPNFSMRAVLVSILFCVASVSHVGINAS